MKPTVAALLLTAAASLSPAMAADCATTLESNDQMQFNVQRIAVPQACKSFTVTLKHTGKMPKASMGHNVVLTTSADANAVAADGMKAGAGNHYVKPNDARVLAFSPLIGGGESTTMTINPAHLQAGTEYTYFCSFPGHAYQMRGTLVRTP